MTVTRPSAPLRARQRRSRQPESGKRTDIQGLRALAVALVVAFHLYPRLLPGGYIGVDVFFVISGYLITGHLVRELVRSGRIRIGEFWARRVRRLLPASIFILAVCVGFTFLFMPEISRVQNLTEIAFAAGYVLNWHLSAAAVDYLNASNPASLVQHYWSLSVEEQFYLVWPVLLTVAALISLAVSRRRRRNREEPFKTSSERAHRGGVLVVLLLVLVVSFAFSVIETARSQPSAYFITTTRAWEFAIGGLVAMIRPVPLPDVLRAVLSWAAILILGVCAVRFGASTAFPGWIALVPVAATALLIAIGDRASTRWSPQQLGNARAVQVLGDLSYSVYLWHWPLILVFAAQFPATPMWVRACGILGLTLLLAYLTERFVERPIRAGRGILGRKAVTFGAMALGVAAILTATILPANAIQAEITQRQEALQSQLTSTGTKGCSGAQAVYNHCADPFAYTASIDPAFAQGDSPWAWFAATPASSACTEKTVGTWVERSCTFPGKGAHVLLLGDSHADHIAAPLQRVATAQGWDFRLESRQACNPFRVASPSDDENAARCAEWGATALARAVADTRLDTVIVSTRTDSGDWADNAKTALSALKAAGKKVILINDVPNVDGRAANAGGLITGPACVTAAGKTDDACSWPDNPQDDWLIATGRSLGMPIVDLRSVVCPDRVCHAIVGGLIAYSDEDHFSGSYALTLTGWFEKTLPKLVK